MTGCAALCGCPPPVPPAEACDRVGVEVGDGPAPFERRLDGETLELTYGPQGGHHIDVSLRIAGLGSPVTAVLGVVDDETASALSWAQYDLAGEQAGPCDQALFDLRAILDARPVGVGSADEVLAGRSLTLEASVADPKGRAAEASLTLWVRELGG